MSITVVKPQSVITQFSNKAFAEQNNEFKSACKLAKVEPTRRQASKFRMGKGLAFKMK